MPHFTAMIVCTNSPCQFLCIEGDLYIVYEIFVLLFSVLNCFTLLTQIIAITRDVLFLAVFCYAEIISRD